MPVLKKNLEPKVVNVRPILKRLHGRVKAQHDLHARRKPVKFQQGDQVVVRRGQEWQKGVIEGKHSAPRSYFVRQLGRSGRALRRNTYHLKRSITQPDRHDDVIRPYDIEGLLAPAEMHCETEVISEVNPVEIPGVSAPSKDQISVPHLIPVVLLSRLNEHPNSRVDNTGKVTRLGRTVRAPKRFDI